MESSNFIANIFFEAEVAPGSRLASTSAIDRTSPERYDWAMDCRQSPPVAETAAASLMVTI